MSGTASGAGIEVTDLHIAMPGPSGPVEIVRGVSFSVPPGGTLALVGESGSGKSLTARSLLGLLPPPTFVSAGMVSVDDVDVRQASAGTLRHLRGGIVGFVPQDPMSALNPVRRIGSLFNEVLARHKPLRPAERGAHVREILGQVGLTDSVLGRYPHQLSGGMKQRVLIALALSTEPAAIVADEPTTALDATVQAQILELLARHVAGRVALIMITHDLGVAATLCDHVAIMYAGQVVETGPIERVLRAPSHPYTKGLLGAAPGFADSGRAGLIPIAGAPPRPGGFPTGCSFAPRCTRATEACNIQPLMSGDEHRFACWNSERSPLADADSRLSNPLGRKAP
jgi:oligopeptide/dipeptide ABC transporter ATP-binding protein